MPPADPSADRRRDALAAGLTLAGLAVSLTFGQLDALGAVHADDLTHYLYAKWAWRWPVYLLDDWGRPGFTALYFLPAGLGWGACRVLSAVLTAGAAWAAYRVACGLDRDSGGGARPCWLVIPLCYAQPLMFQLSQTTLTETPLAFYLAVAVYLAQRGRWAWSSAVISAGFVTRHEAIVFLPVWLWAAAGEPGGEGGIAGRARQALRRTWPILWAVVVVNAGAAWLGMRPAVARFFEPRLTGQYGHGGWLTFFCRSMEAWGPGITLLALVGIAGRWSGGRIRGMVYGCVVVWFAGQTALRALGLYDTGGYARFLVPIGPLVAVAALEGWRRLWDADVRRRMRAAAVSAAAMVLLWAAMERQLLLHAARMDELAELPELHQAKLAIRLAAVLLPALAVAACAGMALRARAAESAGGTRRGRASFVDLLMPGAVAGLILLAVAALCHPLRASAHAVLARQTLHWLDSHGYAGREVLSASVWVDYLARRELPPDRPRLEEQMRRSPAGTLLAWERQFAASPDHGISLEGLRGDPSWRPIHESPPAPYQEEPYLRVFEKVEAEPAVGRAPGGARVAPRGDVARRGRGD